MREIEFRGKTDSGKWCFGYFLHDGQRGRFVITDGLLEINRVDPETVCQFTGLYDSKGHKIYDGDLFRLGEYIIKVVYETENASFALRMINDDFWRLPLDKTFCRDYEVIGNIFDNPELL